MLSVHTEPSEEDYRSFYLGIARTEYLDDQFIPGDVLVGRINDPDMVIRDDLFGDDEWQRRVDGELEEGRVEKLGEDYMLSDLGESPFASDRFVRGQTEANIWNIPSHEYWWKKIPTVVKAFEKAFGEAPPRYLNVWTAFVVTTVAEVLERIGIPFDLEGRAEWAQQFPLDVPEVRLNDELEYAERFNPETEQWEWAKW